MFSHSITIASASTMDKIQSITQEFLSDVHWNLLLNSSGQSFILFQLWSVETALCVKIEIYNDSRLVSEIHFENITSLTMFNCLRYNVMKMILPLLVK